MAYKINLGLRGTMFFVPAQVVDEELRFCGGVQLKVLLMALRENAPELDSAHLASRLALAQEDVCDALDYWVGRGVLEKDGEPFRPRPAAEPEINTLSTTENLQRTPPPQHKPTMAEVERIQKSDPSVAFVLHEAEARLGKAFSSSDTVTLVWLTDWAGIPPDVLITVVEYCKTAGHPNMNYIQKTALEWIDSGIDTIEKAEERMRVLNEQYGWEGRLRSVLEIRGRSLVARERQFSDDWRRLGFSFELIRAAYERTIEGAGKLSFAYMNKILLDWQRKGITTPEQASSEKKDSSQRDAPSFDAADFERRVMLEVPTL